MAKVICCRRHGDAASYINEIEGKMSSAKHASFHRCGVSDVDCYDHGNASSSALHPPGPHSAIKMRARAIIHGGLDACFPSGNTTSILPAFTVLGDLIPSSGTVRGCYLRKKRMRACCPSFEAQPPGSIDDQPLFDAGECTSGG